MLKFIKVVFVFVGDDQVEDGLPSKYVLNQAFSQVSDNSFTRKQK